MLMPRVPAANDTTFPEASWSILIPLSLRLSLPGDAGGGLADDGAQSADHGPAAVNELAFPEPLQAENLVVGRQGVLHHGIRA